jgi:hypothetical protein
MKKTGIFFLLIILTLSTSSLYAQAVSDAWLGFETSRLDINRKGMMALTGWAAINLVSGSIGWATATGPTKYFFQFNTLWNVVNLGLGVAGYLGSVNADMSALTATDILKNYNSMQALYIFNAGLDVAYIATGFYLIERSKNASKNQDVLRGYGSSLILQGSFLLVFDFVMYFLHKKNANLHLYPLVSNDMMGLGMSMKF